MTAATEALKVLAALASSGVKVLVGSPELLRRALKLVVGSRCAGFSPGLLDHYGWCVITHISLISAFSHGTGHCQSNPPVKTTN